MELTSSAFAIARPPRSFFLLPSRFRSVKVVWRVRDFPIACQAFACQDDEEELRVSTLDLGPEPLVVLVYVSLLDRKGNNTHAKCTPWNDGQLSASPDYCWLLAQKRQMPWGQRMPFCKAAHKPDRF